MFQDTCGDGFYLARVRLLVAAEPARSFQIDVLTSCSCELFFRVGDPGVEWTQARLAGSNLPSCGLRAKVTLIRASY